MQFHAGGGGPNIERFEHSRYISDTMYIWADAYTLMDAVTLTKSHLMLSNVPKPWSSACAKLHCCCARSVLPLVVLDQVDRRAKQEIAGGDGNFTFHTSLQQQDHGTLIYDSPVCTGWTKMSSTPFSLQWSRVINFASDEVMRIRGSHYWEMIKFSC